MFLGNFQCPPFFLWSKVKVLLGKAKHFPNVTITFQGWCHRDLIMDQFCDKINYQPSVPNLVLNEFLLQFDSDCFQIA